MPSGLPLLTSRITSPGILVNLPLFHDQVLPTLPFSALQELNLDRNFLVSFAALGGLRSLGVLRLSYNRIESASGSWINEWRCTGTGHVE